VQRVLRLRESVRGHAAQVAVPDRLGLGVPSLRCFVARIAVQPVERVQVLADAHAAERAGEPEQCAHRESAATTVGVLHATTMGAAPLAGQANRHRREFAAVTLELLQKCALC
jgi:hypothetical protein